MRAASAVVLAFAVLTACAQSDPEARAEADWETCETARLPLPVIEACTAVIDNEGSEQSRRATALINRGARRAEIGQHARALADFGRALRLSPDNAQVYLERGLVHQNRGALEAALRSFDAALALDPNMRMALESRQALLAQRLQVDNEQIAQISEQIRREPGNAELLNERCWLRVIHDEDLGLALADCNAALAVNPALAEALDSRGLVQLKRGAAAEALADYEAALKIEPGRGHYLYGRGLARLALGMQAEGEADLAAAEEAEPGIAERYRGYGIQL